MTFQNILLRPSAGMNLDNLQSIRTAVKTHNRPKSELVN